MAGEQTIRQDLMLRMNDKDKVVRMDACREAGMMIRSGSLKRTLLEEVNNHVHTTYSFSPYEPTAAAFAAWQSGLGIVGSIDHDSVGAASEMLEASALLGIASTVGFEVRVGFFDSPFAERKINNPDSAGVVYMCVHGIPRQHLFEAGEFLKPIRTVRNERNRREVELLNTLLERTTLSTINFDRDVLPLSRHEQGGGVTERHILSAFAKAIIERTGIGEPAIEFVERRLGVTVQGKIRTLLADPENPHYHYDLLGLLKGSYLPRFFIQPSREESVDVRRVVDFGRSLGAIPAYAYLGDIAESVTGDKKAERFEDAFLDELIEWLASIGFPAITYMPPRNTLAQMQRLQALCRSHGLMEISGVDINSSRQSFNCPELLAPGARHLVDSAWALVAHEKLSTVHEGYGLFSPSGPLSGLPLKDRIAAYATWGRSMNPFDPYSILSVMDHNPDGLK